MGNLFAPAPPPPLPLPAPTPRRRPPQQPLLPQTAEVPPDLAAKIEQALVENRARLDAGLSVIVEIPRRHEYALPALVTLLQPAYQVDVARYDPEAATDIRYHRPTRFMRDPTHRHLRSLPLKISIARRPPQDVRREQWRWEMGIGGAGEI